MSTFSWPDFTFRVGNVDDGAFTTGANYLGEVFIKLRVEKSHLRLHILVQDQGEHGEHGVDGGIPAPNRTVHGDVKDGQQKHSAELYLTCFMMLTGSSETSITTTKVEATFSTH